MRYINVMKKFITFIIPTVARTSLNNSLNSLLKQTDSEWCAYVGFDGLTEEQIKTDLIKDDRIKYFYLPKTGFLKNVDFKAQNHSKAGNVRNQLLKKQFQSEWIGFLDDDDTLTSDYVERLKLESNKNDFDCCVFRSREEFNIFYVVRPLCKSTRYSTKHTPYIRDSCVV